MPRKPTKSREQKTAEDFFRVKPDDVNYAIEKKYSPMEVELPVTKEVLVEEDTRTEIKKNKKVKGKFKANKK